MSTSESPSIILVHCRELGRFVEPYPWGLNSSKVRTPGFAALAKTGTVFVDAYCNALDADPAGACLLTGKYAHTVGMLGPKSVSKLTDPSVHVAHRLKKKGYSTARFGYNHFQEEAGLLGYDESVDLVGKSATEIAEKAASYIHNQPKPFFLEIGFRETAESFPYLTSMISGRRADDPNVRAMAQCIDEGISVLLEAVKPRLETDLFLFCTTDHGNIAPVVYPDLSDEGIGVLLSVSGPGVSPGKKCEALVSHLNVVPTILKVAGISPPDKLPAGPLPNVPFPSSSSKDPVFFEINVTEGFALSARMTVTDDEYRRLFVHEADGRDMSRRLKIAINIHKVESLGEDVPMYTWMKDTKDPALDPKLDLPRPPLKSVQESSIDHPKRWMIVPESSPSVPWNAWKSLGWESPDSESDQVRESWPTWFNRCPDSLVDIQNWVGFLQNSPEFGRPPGKAGPSIVSQESQRTNDRRKMVANTWLLLGTLGLSNTPAEPVYSETEPSPTVFRRVLGKLRLWCHKHQPASTPDKSPNLADSEQPISNRDATILRAIYELQPMETKTKSIANKAGYAETSVKKAVKQLNDRRLIEKRNKRAWVVTDKGREMLDRLQHGNKVLGDTSKT